MTEVPIFMDELTFTGPVTTIHDQYDVKVAQTDVVVIQEVAVRLVDHDHDPCLLPLVRRRL